MKTLLVITGVLLIAIIPIVIIAGIAHYRRGEELLKEIDEFLEHTK